MYKSIKNLRSIFIDFFKSKDHYYIKSSSLIPNDNSLLFTNAGMNQFKNFFLGIKKSLNKKVVTVQRCLRVGGKYNDLKNIGYTCGHNTFFEMMGNFSFNSYFKKTSILYAWELLTDIKWFNLCKDRLIVTVHINDIETYNIWYKIIGINKNNIILIGNKNINLDIKSDNFWQMSNIGPCGYSTEIFYNLNNISSDKFILFKNSNNFLEIWNLVFIEYYIDNLNKISFLPYKSVDTGMGLERIGVILQNVKSNFDIDIFVKLKKEISKFLCININNKNNFIFNIISDHIRSVVFLIIDGLLPSNEFRGYVLRKIIRRILIYMNLLKINDLVLNNLIFFLKDYFTNYYILENENFFLSIKKIILYEEKKFFSNLFKNLNILNNYLDKNLNIKKLSGKKIFLFYDTYGLPLDIIYEICNYRNIILDIKKFNYLLDLQKKKSKNNSLFKSKFIKFDRNSKLLKTNFLGYNVNCCKSSIIYILKDSISINIIKDYENEYIIILDNTVLYPNCGGQKGDKGVLIHINKKFKFIIYNTKILGDYIIHIGKLKYGILNINDLVKVKYNINYRYNISCNHSSCHILLNILKKEVSNNIVKYSNSINNKYFTLDFIYNKKINSKLLSNINILVNKKFIWNNHSLVENFISSNNDVNKKFVFLNNDNNIIRTIKFGKFKEEYCCGTHVKNTRMIGIFYISKCYSISNNIYRIKVYTNISALKFINNRLLEFKKVSNLLSVNRKKVYNSLISIINKIKIIKKENSKINSLFILNILNLFSKYDFRKFLKFNFLIKLNFNINILDYNMLFIILDKLYIKYNLFLIVLFININNKNKLIIYKNNILLPNFNINLSSFDLLKNIKFETIKNEKFVCKIFDINIVKNKINLNKFIYLIKVELLKFIKS